MTGRGPAPDFVTAAAELGIPVISAEPMARHTTYHIGGPADLYAMAGDRESLAMLAETAWKHGLPAMVLGGGSNILVSDAGIRGLVIGNGYREIRLDETDATGPVVIAGAGAPFAGLARWTMRAGLSGLEWAVSVPGTVGGAVIGNAGAHGGETAARLAWALVAYPGKGRQMMRSAELGYSYRNSLLKEQLAQDKRDPRLAPVVLEAGFRLMPGTAEVLEATAQAYLAHRRATQPVEPSAGSVFRNPPGDYAGRLVEAVGLKGHQIGGAQVSQQHANFIVNTGGARATDVRTLMDLVRARVARQFGVHLVAEILLIGDWHQERGENCGSDPERD
jgi:UDP-N-acetylmuramate dehydrogenase